MLFRSYFAINTALEALDNAGWISRNDVYQWVLLRDMNRLALIDLMRLVPSFSQPDMLQAMVVDEADRRLQQRLLALNEWSAANLNTPLNQLIAADGGPGSHD